MAIPFQSAANLARKTYALARPYGRGKLLAVLAVSLAQGIVAVLGVTSIFPFLALAADPGRLQRSHYGQKLLAGLPPMSEGQLLLWAGMFAILMLVAANAMNLIGDFVRTRYANSFSHWLRMGLLRQMASRPYGDFLQQNTGVLLKKVSYDVANYTGYILLPLLDSVTRLTTIILLVAALFLVHPQIALSATLVLGLFYIAVFRGFGTWRARTSESLKRVMSGTMVEAQQFLGGIKPVKVHCAEETFLERYRGFSTEQARLLTWLPIIGNAPRYFIEPLAFGGLVIVVLMYAARGQDLAVILPNLGVMALAAYRLLPSFQLLYSQFTGLTAAQHSLDEVYQEFKAVEDSMHVETRSARNLLAKPNPLRWSQEIRLEDVSFCYPGAPRPVLNGLNLVIKKNSSLGIVGATGSGKSTLVDLVLGLHWPTKGKILVDGTPLDAANRRAWRCGIGYVPQDIFLIDDTITANIAFGVPSREVDQARVREVAAAAQLNSFIEKELPLGYDTVVGERGVRLSGGQRQRIGLARALYHRPELLVLDEATSALDNETEKEVMKAINGLQGSITMLIIAHRLSTVERCQERLDLGALHK